MIDLAPVRLGPLVLSGERALVVLVLAAALVTAEIVARRRGGDADWAWGGVLVGLAAARAAWVVAHAGAYAPRPLEVLYVWQGGFVAWAGAVAGVAWAAYRLRRSGAGASRMTVPLGAAAAVGFVAALALPVAPTPPAWSDVRASVVALDGGAVPAEAPSAGPVPVAAWVGTPTVVNLWATWCGPCRRELPLLVDVVGGRGDVRLALVSQGERAETVRAYLEAEALPGRGVWLDRGGEVGRALSAAGLPTTAFVDASGEVVEVAFGELSRARLEAALLRIGVAP